MVGNMRDWVQANEDRVFRYVVYKRIWTPYEMDQKFEDESEFADSQYCFGKIKEVVKLGDGEWLLGFSGVDPETKEEFSPMMVEYFRLSEIRLSYFEYDSMRQEDFDDERSEED